MHNILMELKTHVLTKLMGALIVHDYFNSICQKHITTYNSVADDGIYSCFVFGISYFVVMM